MSLLQHHNSKASFLQSSAFFMFQLSHPYVTTGKSVALICTLVFFFLSFPFFIPSLLHLFIKFTGSEHHMADSASGATGAAVNETMVAAFLLLSNLRDHGYCWGERRPEDGVFFFPAL